MHKFTKPKNVNDPETIRDIYSLVKTQDTNEPSVHSLLSYQTVENPDTYAWVLLSQTTEGL